MSKQFVIDLRFLIETCPKIKIKLNKDKTLLCYEYNKIEYPIENDGNIVDKATYNEVSTALQNNELMDKIWGNKNYKSAEKHIIDFLIKKQIFEDPSCFLKEFKQFINDLPDVSKKVLDYRRRLMEINKKDSKAVTLEEFEELNRMIPSFDINEAIGESGEKNVNELYLQNANRANAFAEKYPKQINAINRIFGTLNSLERSEDSNDIMNEIAEMLGLSTISVAKLICYFDANVENPKEKQTEVSEISKWYNDEDMNTFGRGIEKFGVNINTQFSNRLTDNGIKSMPSMELLEENQPRYICYNIGGNEMQDNSGDHWVAMLLVKRADKVIILYKDSKGDWNNSSRNIEAAFREHYNNKLEFIRNLNQEQKDDSSCGPMTINNLHIMAKKIMELNDAGGDGIGELIKIFKGEYGDMAFTTPDQVKNVRISHLEQKTLTTKANIKKDDGIETLTTIIEQFRVSENKQLPNENIHRYMNIINSFYDGIESWGVDELNTWTNTNAGELSKDFGNQAVNENEVLKAIAVMDRANEIATGGHRLRDSQIVAILIFMATNETGHISQINTGEGKTTIISVIAALKVLQGYKVHVITSNNVLAAEGVTDKSLFYLLLNITVAHNNPDEYYTDGPKSCYSKHIVYGSITSFQFDFLRDSFEKLKTLGGIDYSNIWVLLDEIDSLLIDQGSNIAKLSGPFPGMESLRYIYINIWAALEKAEEKVTHQILGKLNKKAVELMENNAMSVEEKQLKYREYEDALKKSNYYLNELKQNIMERKKDLLNKNITVHHLHQYAEGSLERWIEHALTAKFLYQENVEYKIVKDKNGERIIIPVDNQNTGVTMKNTILSNGLHQFLQIKHNLCLTYESLTSCYVSNLEYIKKYGSKLSGVTGTLGSTPEQNLLGSVFDLSFSVIPPFKAKMFKQYPGRISTDERFVNDVAISALGQLTRDQPELSQDEKKEKMLSVYPRAVLIVCASILDVRVIYETLEKAANAAGLNAEVIEIVDEKHAEKITKETIKTNTVVIATNLAGRGTDFKTSLDLEQNGGLHVIEAFLACNQRVQDQGFGRTARQGNKGTGQIIARSSEVEALGIPVNSVNINEELHFDTIIYIRDQLEELRLNDIQENKILELEFKGQLFNKFAETYGSLKKAHQTGVGNEVLNWIYVLRDLKEKWAFWLERQAYTLNKIKQIVVGQKSWISTNDTQQLIKRSVDKEYKMFLSESQQILEGSISHNPYYSICLADKYLENSCDKNARVKAESELQHALIICSSSELLYSAYMKLFEIAIEDGNQIFKRCNVSVRKLLFGPLNEDRLENNYKKDAIKYLKNAEKAISIEHDYLKELIEGKNDSNEGQESTVLASIINQEVDSNVFLKHLVSRLVCLGAFKGNIESLIQQINENENDDFVIECKAQKYLSKLDSNNELKKYITERSVDELEYVGMSCIYQLRKIPVEVKNISSNVQIRLALNLLACSVCFPVLYSAIGTLAIGPIVKYSLSIFTQLFGPVPTDSQNLITAELISNTLSLVKAGIDCVPQIYQAVVNASRGLGTQLTYGYFAEVCESLGNQLSFLQFAFKPYSRPNTNNPIIKSNVEFDKFALKMIPFIKITIETSVKKKITKEHKRNKLKIVPDYSLYDALEKCFNSDLEDDLNGIKKTCIEVLQRKINGYFFQKWLFPIVDVFRFNSEIDTCTKKICDKLIALLTSISHEPSNGDINKEDEFIKIVVSTMSAKLLDRIVAAFDNAKCK